MSNVIKPLGCLGAWIIMLGLGALHAAEQSTDWKAGAARVDTTPSSPVLMSGYASRNTPSQGVSHPLAAKALALSDAKDNRIVFVTCDIIGFGGAFTGRVTERVKDKYGLPRENIVLIASHTHAGPTLRDASDPARANANPDAPRPNFQNNLDYTKELENKIVNLVGEALSKMEPASLSYGVGRAHFTLNRREPTADGTIKLGKNPAGPTDESVPILRVMSASGKPLAIVFGYACHNTTLRPDMMKIDADYAGYAQDRIEADNPGAIALFVTGCGADADPHPFGTVAMAKDHGEELGEAVKFVIDHPAWWTSLSGPLRSEYREIKLRLHPPPQGAAAEKKQGRPNRTENPYAVQVFAIGDQLTMVALASEVVVDYAIRLQKELGGKGKDLWMAAYANLYLGYIPSVRLLREGGYEARTPYTDDVESTIVDTARELVEKVREKK
jgi:Neutral/alkaline non-lysosomal ceramidase, N-terminal